MTCREKLAIEHPDYVNEDYGGGCWGCPQDYGYNNRPDYCDEKRSNCNMCWDRKIPEDEPAPDVAVWTARNPKDDSGDSIYYCSHCKSEVTAIKSMYYKYCYNCGKAMSTELYTNIQLFRGTEV